MAAACAMPHTYKRRLTSDQHDMRSHRRRLAVSAFARDKARHYLACHREYRLPDLVWAQLTEVVRGYSAGARRTPPSAASIGCATS